jgi:Domain of unknown function (DUF4184)
MAPDFPYFLWMRHQHFAHTLPGVFYFCLPVGLAMLWIYHSWLKAPMLSLAPDGIRRRVNSKEIEFPWWPLSRLVLIALSLLVGTSTHLLWDGFTHERGWFVQDMPELGAKVPFWPHSFALYTLLQHGSTVFGLAVLAWSVRAWVRRTPTAPDPAIPSLPSRLRMFLVPSAAGFACGLGAYLGYIRYGQPVNRIGYSWMALWTVKSVVVAITATFVELMVFALIWRLVLYPSSQQGPGPRNQASTARSLTDSLDP